MTQEATLTMHQTLECRQGKLMRLGSTERVKNLNEQFHKTRPNVCLHGIRTYTKVYKATENEPAVLKRGKAIAEILSTIPPVIMPYELIVGQPGCRLRGMTIRPPMLGWVQIPGEIESLDTRNYDPWVITEGQKKELKQEILPDWKNKTVREIWTEKAKEIYPNEWWILTDTLHVNLVNYLHSIGSHINPPYEDILAKGFKWYEQKAKDKLKQCSSDQSEKASFYEAVLKTINGMQHWSQNYKNYALKLAAKEKDPVRASELKRISDIVGRVPYEPASNFQEALQSVYFTNCFLWLEGSGCAYNLGRADRYLSPFYQRDIDSGILTKEQALELIECLWIKMTGIHWLNGAQVAEFSPGYFPFQQVDVGGIGKNLRYYANELSYMFADALINVRTTQPTLCVLWHRDMPWELKAKAVELINAGMGHPSIINYEQLIMMRMNDDPGERWEDLIWDAKPIGCSEPQGEGCRQFGHTSALGINGGAVVDLVFTKGIKRVGYHSGEKVGVDTGPVESLKTFDDFKEAVQKQMEYMVDLGMRGAKIGEKVIAENNEVIVQSIFTDDCIEKGIGCAKGGARYPVGPHFNFIGTADMANSLAAIKKCVYEDKTVTLEKLAEALEANFVGYDDVYKNLSQAPKYGNDDDYVDDIAREIWLHLTKTLRKYRNNRGGTPGATATFTSAGVPAGYDIGALPSPRYAMKPLADGVSPQQGTDMLGPTAVLKSVAKLPYPAITGGTIANLWVSGDSLKSDEGMVKFINLLDTYMYEGGFHIQVNSMSKKTLMDAQKHPSNYPTLMVRVAGYSAYFVDLAKPTQDDIISRTEHAI